MPKHYKFAVYCSNNSPHGKTYGALLLGRFRWRWLARLSAWFWEKTVGAHLGDRAWVREEDVTVSVENGRAV